MKTPVNKIQHAAVPACKGQGQRETRNTEHIHQLRWCNRKCQKIIKGLKPWTSLLWELGWKSHQKSKWKKNHNLTSESVCIPDAPDETVDGVLGDPFSNLDYELSSLLGSLWCYLSVSGILIHNITEDLNWILFWGTFIHCSRAVYTLFTWSQKLSSIRRNPGSTAPA